MRNILAFLAFCFLSFAIVGGYLGWYSPRTGMGPDGKPSLSIDFNPAKIREDLKHASETIEKKLADRAAQLEAERRRADEQMQAGPRKGS
jgi:hypothetical protein